MITLRKWHITGIGSSYYAKGIVFGHDSFRCPDGAYIHTSEIKSAEFDGDILIHTKNSTYLLSIDEMNCEKENVHKALGLFEYFARDMDIDECLPQIKLRCEELEKNNADFHSRISRKLPENALYLEFSDSGVYLSMGIFKNSMGKTEIINDIRGVRTNGGKLSVNVDYLAEFIPYKNHNIEFIAHSELNLNKEILGIIKNVGENSLNIKFSWGKTVILSPDCEIEVYSGMGAYIPLSSREQEL